MFAIGWEVVIRAQIASCRAEALHAEHRGPTTDVHLVRSRNNLLSSEDRSRAVAISKSLNVSQSIMDVTLLYSKVKPPVIAGVMAALMGCQRVASLQW